MENVKVILDGKEMVGELPYLFDDFTTNIKFLNDTIEQYQPDVDINELTFSGESAKFINEFVENNGIFRKLDVVIKVEDVTILDGYLFDYTFSADRNIVKCSFSIKDGLNSLSEKLQSISSLLLSDKYTFSDLEFVIEPTDEQSKERLLIIGLATITYTYILIQLTKEGKSVIIAFTKATPDEQLAKFLELAAFLLYVSAIVVSIGKYFIELKNILFPSVRRTKVISLKNLMEVPLTFLGYNLVTNITDLEKVHHWASRYTQKQQSQLVQGLTFNKKLKKPNLYVPNSNDRLSNALEVFKFVQEKYCCRFFVDGNTVYCFHKADPFWDKLTTHQIDDDLPLEEFKYNYSEHNTSKEISYSIDDLDQYTYDEFQGSHFLITSQLYDWKKSTAKGFKRVDYGLARTYRKDQLNAVEFAFDILATAFNKLTKALKINGGNPIIATRFGVAKISSDKFSVAKLCYLDGTKIIKNHYEKLSAKRDYEEWQWADSFIQNTRNKKKIYENVKIKCDLSIFRKILNNKYVVLKSGEKAEIRNFEWKQRKNYANCTLAVENDYLTGLIEEYYESEQ